MQTSRRKRVKRWDMLCGYARDGIEGNLTRFSQSGWHFDPIWLVFSSKYANLVAARPSGRFGWHENVDPTS